jgi:hypothetical protein
MNSNRHNVSDIGQFFTEYHRFQGEIFAIYFHDLTVHIPILPFDIAFVTFILSISRMCLLK